MKKKKYCLITLILMSIFLSCSLNVYAKEDTKATKEKIMLAGGPKTSVDGLFPSLDTLDVNSNQPRNFDKYPLSRYMFDTKEFGIFDVWATVLNSITNVLFMLNVYISYAANYLLMACFKFNIFQLISSVFNNIVWAVRDAVFNPLVGPILAVAGLALIFNAAVGKFNSAWRIAINTILVLAISFAFFAKPSLSIDMVNDMSQSVSGEILAATARVATGSKLTADDAVVNLGNVFWENTVVKPWQLIQFGDTETGASEMDGFLSHPPGDSTRVSKAEELSKNNELFTPAGQVTRFVMVLFVGLIVLAIDVFIIILSGLTVILQFASVISAVIMIIAFITALLPNMGFRVAAHGMYNTFGFCLAKIGMTILIAVYFSINTALYSLSSQYGWLLVTLLQLLLIATVVLYRNQIMGFAKSVTGGQQSAIENVHQKRDTFKDLTKGALKVYGMKKVYDDVSNMREARNDKNLSKKYKPVADDYMMQKYNNEKLQAEEKAKTLSQRSGEKVQPEYSDFVKRVNTRIDKGFTPFDERDVDSTVEMMKSLHRQGNNPKNLLTTKIDGKEDEEIRVKQHEMESSIDKTKENLNERRVKNSDTINRTIKSDKESKLYDSPTAMKYKIKELGNFNKNDDIVISSRNNGAIREIENDRMEKEFTEMKKRDAAENSSIGEKVVNGDNVRPIRRTTIKRDNNSTAFEAAEKNPYKDIGTAEGAEIEAAPPVNRTSEVNHNNIENVKEVNRKEPGNIINEKTNVVESTENVKNREVNNVEAATNTVQKTNEVKHENKNVENVNETNKKESNNVTSETTHTVETTENIKNKEINNTESTVNTVNKDNEVRHENKNIENISVDNLVNNISADNKRQSNNGEYNGEARIKDLEDRLSRMSKMVNKNNGKDEK